MKPSAPGFLKKSCKPVALIDHESGKPFREIVVGRQPETKDIGGGSSNKQIERV